VKKVFIAIPTVGTIVDFLPHMLRKMEAKYKGELEFVYPPQLVQRRFHDFARNLMVEEFLKTDCDILWFIDSDVVPPEHTPDLITKHCDKWLVAGASYPIWMMQPNKQTLQVTFTAYKGIKDGSMAPCLIPDEGTEFVDGLATGCLMIKRELFDKLEKPYFEFKYKADDRELIEGEDLGFCLKLAKLGIKFFTDYSMVCKHYKTVCLLDVNNYAVEFAKSSVANYDASVRENLAERIQQMVAASRAKSSLILP
jgi:hypothetical protein